MFIHRISDGNAAKGTCFGLDAWPPEVICPDLVDKMRTGETDIQQWVNNVVRRIPAWAGSVLKTADSDALEDTCQEFCATMIEYRPDLAYDATKASKRTFLSSILKYTHWRILRGRQSREKDEGLDLNLAEAATGDPVEVAENRELMELVKQWINELPEKERVALGERSCSTQCACLKKAVHAVRRCRALRRLRDLAKARSLCEVQRRSRRFRTRRIRVPYVRLVGSVARRSACLSKGSVPS